MASEETNCYNDNNQLISDKTICISHLDSFKNNKINENNNSINLDIQQQLHSRLKCIEQLILDLKLSEEKYQKLEALFNKKSKENETLQDVLDEQINLNVKFQDNNKLTKSFEENLREHNNYINRLNQEHIESKDEASKYKSAIKALAEKDDLLKQQNEQIQNFHELFEKKLNELNEYCNSKQKELNSLQKTNEENNVEKEAFKKQLDNLNQILQNNVETIKSLEERLKEKNKEIKDLEQKNIVLIGEASKYQTALGAAINLRLSDYEYNSVTLKNGILNLQDSLEDYTNYKRNVEINIEGVQNLLIKYGSQTVITKGQKPLIKAVLQRHVVEQIIVYAQEYFDNQNLHQGRLYGIETTLFAKANELINLIENFVQKRTGTDDATQISIKLRQQIFEALGNRGFNNMITNSKKTIIHKFIEYNQSNLNSEIGKYRIIKDPKKKQEIEEMAAGIIQKVISLFWFRTKTQEPVAEFVWVNPDAKIDPSYMEGKWEDDEIDDLVVDICYFPTISQEFDNKSKRIFTPARIFPKSKKSSK
ncbi:11194_t:CDS:1 [Funneliformis mosseae]|uniref:11194_t:CDS:1 n=1 Tax=Funneliformis mosseae TaxID=27381 RepID=A0A9N9EKJ3_FUNMO|nr:11194_t:CDS:1 [Funneliformis mosseae]